MAIVPHPQKDIPAGTVDQFIGKPDGRRTKRENAMTHYIALIHKEADSSFGVSFPDVPGVVTAADTLDEAMKKAAEVLEFAAEDWLEQTGSEFPPPRTIDELRGSADFQDSARDAVIAAVPLRDAAQAAE
jgi:antitoxin HicB